MTVTDAMLSAVKWLINRGGDGVFAERNHAVLMARNERCGVMRATWNRCVRAELCEAYGRGRLRVTEAGRQAVKARDTVLHLKRKGGLPEADCSEVDWGKYGGSP